MNRYLIDGYNLLRTRAFSVPAHLDLEAQRNHLIRLLSSFAGQTRSRIRVVFDGASRGGTGNASRGTRIIFSRRGEEADEVIKRLIRREKDRHTLTVVSSDREIQHSAEDHGISVMDSDSFCARMKSPAAAKKPAAEMKQRQAKYNGQISESEIDYWKNLFESRERED